MERLLSTKYFRMEDDPGGGNASSPPSSLSCMIIIHFFMIVTRGVFKAAVRFRTADVLSAKWTRHIRLVSTTAIRNRYLICWYTNTSQSRLYSDTDIELIKRCIPIRMNRLLTYFTWPHDEYFIQTAPCDSMRDGWDNVLLFFFLTSNIIEIIS